MPIVRRVPRNEIVNPALLLSSYHYRFFQHLEELLLRYPTIYDDDGVLYPHQTIRHSVTTSKEETIVCFSLLLHDTMMT
jgi:hypothetical protein